MGESMTMETSLGMDMVCSKGADLVLMDLPNAGEGRGEESALLLK